MRLVLAACAFALSFIGLPAYAHTAYLLPRDFTPDGGAVTIEAGYATQFFTSAIGLSSPDLHAVAPDGTSSGFEATDVNAQRGLYTLNVPTEGTYRITTGEMLGAVTNMVAVDGQWRALGAGETPPEGAETSTLQTAIVADTYVSKVRPTERAYATPVGRLAIVPITHPNRISVATGFEVQLLFDGQPMGNMAIVLYSAGDPETKLDRFVTTDANGHALFSFTQPGAYMIAARQRAPAPPGSPAQVRSYTTTLTFEVVQDLPPIPPAPPPEPTRRRRH
ncbi:MAG TPA: DUF4198 domain-containing protein [Caulobacterales bacterium]|nr:DUF4198 domain-containing protein [Caulobacterales bacterium]